MSMFTVSGKVIHTFRAERNNDGKIESKPKVQILGEVPLPASQSRMDLITLSCESERDYDALIGSDVRIPIGIFAPAKGQIVYFIPAGAKPEVVV